MNEQQISEIVEDLSAGFEMVFHSGSSTGSIARWVAEHLQDEGIRPRKPLARLIAKRLQLWWQGEIIFVKQQIAKEQ
jgi:hypothetical protein